MENSLHFFNCKTLIREIYSPATNPENSHIRVFAAFSQDLVKA